ncbi:MAG: hypothetical protein V3V33_04535 [Candidatus Lokiarchaeia archaeon]
MGKVIFEKMNKDPIYFQLLILDVLTHDLLEEYEREVLKFTQEFFIEIINLID